MGLAMAGTLVRHWNFVSNGLWELVFAVIALWFLALSIRFAFQHGIQGTDDAHVHHISHYLIHFVMACAMLYMYWLSVPTPRSNMSTSAGVALAGDPGLTLLLAAILFASAVWQLDSIARFAPRPRALVSASGPTTTVTGVGAMADERGGVHRDGAEPWLAPRLEIGCHIAMCITMGYMLILML